MHKQKRRKAPLATPLAMFAERKLIQHCIFGTASLLGRECQRCFPSCLLARRCLHGSRHYNALLVWTTAARHSRMGEKLPHNEGPGQMPIFQKPIQWVKPQEYARLT